MIYTYKLFIESNFKEILFQSKGKSDSHLINICYYLKDIFNLINGLNTLFNIRLLSFDNNIEYESSHIKEIENLKKRFNIIIENQKEIDQHIDEVKENFSKINIQEESLWLQTHITEQKLDFYDVLNYIIQLQDTSIKESNMLINQINEFEFGILNLKINFKLDEKIYKKFIEVILGMFNGINNLSETIDVFIKDNKLIENKNLFDKVNKLISKI